MKKTASEIREIAWAALGRNDGWLINIVVIFGIAMAAAMIVMPFSIGEQFGQVFMQGAQGADSDDAKIAMGLIGFMIFLVCLVARFVCNVYTQGFQQYGMARASLDTIRDRANWSAFYSGWGMGWRTGGMNMLMGLFVFLWFMIPIAGWFWFGPRALYSYRMANLIRVDHREWTAMECLDESKRLMEGNRMRLFALDFSFLGWWLLGIITCCVGYLLVAPYCLVAQAAFYQELLNEENVGNAIEA